LFSDYALHAAAAIAATPRRHAELPYTPYAGYCVFAAPAFTPRHAAACLRYPPPFDALLLLAADAATLTPAMPPRQRH
jgi:hypothetical protein